MKNCITKLSLLLFFSFCQLKSVVAIDSTKISISLNYSIDLSDTYGGGNLFSGESTVSFSWYGIKASYGHMNSQYYSLLEVPYNELGQTLEITVPEISFMNIGSISVFMRPVSKKWITTDIVFGASIGRAKSFFLKDIEYEYNTEEKRITYLFTDYHYAHQSHFGYHAGIDLMVYLYKNFGIQFSSRIHDMNQGSFFFIGTGLCFRL